MTTCVVVSPKLADTSARNLARWLDCDYDNPYQSKKRNYTNYDVVFNYGFSREITANRVFNKQLAVNIARDKQATLDRVENMFNIPHTTDIRVAEDWIRDGHSTVVARTLLKSNNGKGITFCDSIEELNKVKEVKLYTKYINHTNEFRVNVWRDKVLSIYDKIVCPNQNFKFKLFRGQENHPQLVALVKDVYDKIKLDFCGIDILRDKEGKLYVLEINSAPVLFPYTLNKLTTEIKKEM